MNAPKGVIQDIQKGFRLLGNGHIIVDIPRDEYGFNRWRNVASHCATALMVFPRSKFGEHLERLVKDLEYKINALRFGYLTVDFLDGQAVFVFDWSLLCGQELSLKGQGNNEYILNVAPKPGKELKKWVIAYGALFDLDSVIFASPGSDYQRINCSLIDPQLRGQTEEVVLTSEKLNAQSCSQEEMMAALLGLPTAEEISLSREVTANRFIGYYNIMYGMFRMNETIHEPIEQPDGSMRSLEDLEKQNPEETAPLNDNLAGSNVVYSIEAKPLFTLSK